MREDQGMGRCGPQATNPSDPLFHFSRTSIDPGRCPPLAGEGYEVLLSLQEGSSLMESASGTVLSREIGLDGRRGLVWRGLHSTWDSCPSPSSLWSPRATQRSHQRDSCAGSWGCPHRTSCPASASMWCAGPRPSVPLALEERRNRNSRWG